MKIEFRSSFLRDLKKIKNKKIRNQIKDLIDDIENAENFSGLKNVKKLSGSNHYYRIRLNEYRIGIYYNNSNFEFIRCLHRKEVYKYFP